MRLFFRAGFTATHCPTDLVQSEHRAGMHKYVAFGVKLRRLLAAAKRHDLRQHLLHEPALHE